MEEQREREEGGRERGRRGGEGEERGEGREGGIVGRKRRKEAEGRGGKRKGGGGRRGERENLVCFSPVCCGRAQTAVFGHRPALQRSEGEGKRGGEEREGTNSEGREGGDKMRPGRTTRSGRRGKETRTGRSEGKNEEREEEQGGRGLVR